MANAKYDKGREKILTRQIDWVNDTIRAYLVDMDDYSLNIAQDEYLSAVPNSARIANAELSGKTATNGYANADTITWENVSGDQAEGIVICKWTGSDGSSPLIVFLDDVSNLPVEPGGGQIEVRWPANGIFRI